jgi:hypothetical protein
MALRARRQQARLASRTAAGEGPDGTPAMTERTPEPELPLRHRRECTGGGG